MAIKLFGFNISRGEDEIDRKLQGFATPVSDDGASTVQAGGHFGTYVDLDATAKSEYELITRYREAAMYSDTSAAIDEILTEAIAAVDDEALVQINLDQSKIPQDIKDSIIKEFEVIYKLIEFDTRGFDYFRRWYIDGRIYFQKIIDTSNPKRGILETLIIDPRKIKKIRQQML